MGGSVECQHCGKPLPRDAGWGRKFCDGRCKQRFAAARKRAEAPTPTCAHCGVEMPGAMVTRKFCTNRCAQRSRQAAKLEQAPTPQCAHCGAVMPKPVKPGENRKYCSTRCRDRFYAKKNAEARSARNKKWREENKETLRDKKRAYRLAHLDEHKARDRERYLRNREHILELARLYYERNSDEVRARVQKYLDAKSRDPEWVAKERERSRKKWHNATPRQKEAWRRRGQRRQSRKNLQRVGSVSAADWAATLRVWNYACAYCGTSLEVNEHGNVIADVEHVIPISRGGAHSVGNIVPACEGCNHRKSKKLLVEWRYSARGMQRLARGPLAMGRPKQPLP